MLKIKTIILALLFPLFITISVFSQESEAPATPLVENEMIESPSETRYTDEEFAQLSDEEKWNIYYNFPQQLPENFNPDVYTHILHPENENTED